MKADNCDSELSTCHCVYTLNVSLVGVGVSCVWFNPRLRYVDPPLSVEISSVASTDIPLNI